MRNRPAMPPPPAAEQLASRLFLGPALRTQSDRRLVTLVREGYEAAFEEIVRRYRRPLDRFAAAFVGGRSEDVTQDAFSKALLALRGSDTEIALRPWLYRIVRNTALNEIRDRPAVAEQLDEMLEGGHSAATEVERREEMAELMERLRALPDPQRAAIVMRELEGLSHAEIAATLGVSGGAARQAIHRARVALRDGLGMLIPLPLLRLLIDHGAEAAGAGAGGAVAAGAAAGTGSTGAVLGGLGAGAAVKVGVATALIAGTVGAGVALHHSHGASEPQSLPATAASADLPTKGGSTAPTAEPVGSTGLALSEERGFRGGDDEAEGDGGRDASEQGHGQSQGHGRSGDDFGPDEGFDEAPHGGPGPGNDGGGGGRGASGVGPPEHGGGQDGRHPLGLPPTGEGPSGGEHPPRGSGGGGSNGSGGSGGSGSFGADGNGGGGHDGGSGDSHGGGGPGPNPPPPVITPPPPPPSEVPPASGSENGGGEQQSSSGSGGSGEDGS
ncbi:MAG TPA: sigma-70 family RNA polymerase sigma factor [Solirubrobacterales bacterium]|nr:sigma-70 family RNA polymerase sigma factor [Solirubrobacterales bacterium]